jgi:hypothetical protein
MRQEADCGKRVDPRRPDDRKTERPGIYRSPSVTKGPRLSAITAVPPPSGAVR